MPRRTTKLESEGAEFLVLGQLLARGIAASKSYTNQRGYDLVAYSPETKRLATIQVKSRWAKSAGHFLIKKEIYEFVVFVKLNADAVVTASQPLVQEYYVLPAREAVTRIRDPNTLSYVRFDKKRFEKYRDGWNLIRDFLDGTKATRR